MKRKINWAILGCGKIAKSFAKDLQLVADTKLYAVGSRTKENAEEFATEYGFEKAYGSYEALVKDPKVDAVYIATPHPFHHPNTLLCLHYNKAVLCEKPFAMNLQEVEEMIALAKSKDVLLMEAMWTRFLPNYEYVRHHLQLGTWGKVLKLEADFGFDPPFDKDSRLFNKSLGGGSLLDIGIYPIFLALSTLGIPEAISAKATIGKTGVDETCDITFNYRDQTIANLHATLRERTATEAIFYCENATISMHTNFYRISDISIKTNGNTEKLSFENLGIGYYREADHFTKLLLDGKKESPLMTHEFSLQLIQMLDNVREQIGLIY